MPHISVKLFPGRTEEMKRDLAQKLAKDVAESLKVDMGDVSVSFEEVEREDWGEKVYQKEILAKSETIYQKPNYSIDKVRFIAGKE